jgi:hypothetical protein
MFFLDQLGSYIHYINLLRRFVRHVISRTQHTKTYNLRYTRIIKVIIVVFISEYPKDFEHSPRTEVGVGKWDISSASRKVNNTQSVVGVVVKDQGFLPAPIRPTCSHKASTPVPRTLKIKKKIDE